MKVTPDVLCGIGAAICVSAVAVLWSLDLSYADTVLVRVLRSLMLGCFLVQIGYARSPREKERERESRDAPPENPE
jgi:hypothetical protein